MTPGISTTPDAASSAATDFFAAPRAALSERGAGDNDARSFALLLDQQRKFTGKQTGNIVLELTSEVRHSHISLVISLLFWAASVLSCVWSFYTGQSIGLRIFTGMATIWTALWSAYLAKNLDKPRLGELTVLTALLGFAGMLLTASTQLGFPLQTAGGICLLAAASLAVAALTYSRIGLMASISACLVWAALHFDGYLASSAAMIALPFLIGGQILLGAKLASRTAMFAAVIVIYVWLGGFAWAQYSTGALSPVFLAAGIFLVGGVHLQVSKAADDEGLDSTPIHILFAWGLAIMGLIGVQHYSLYPGHALWSSGLTTAPLHKLGWGLVMATCTGLIGLAGLVRRRHGRMTFLTVVLMTGLYALLPLSVWFEDYLTGVALDQTGVYPHPAFGMFLGGVIIASAMTFVLNNIRRKRYILSVAGLGVIALQGDMSLKGDFLQSGDNVLMIVTGLILGTGLFAILAKAQFDPQAPQRRLKSYGDG